MSKAFQLSLRLVAVLFGVGVLISANASLGELASPATKTIRLPPRVEQDIPLAQIFDYGVQDKHQFTESGRVIVWGASEPNLGQDIYTTFYYPMSRDMNRQRNLAWYKQNRPNWVVYMCDRTSPAYLYIYTWGAYTPLDISNSQVREYLLDTFLLPAVQRGYPAIGLDNVSLNNTSAQCGIWDGDAWIAKYNGHSRDQKYTDAIIDYIAFLRQQLHSHATAIALNFTLDIAQIAQSERLLRLADIWFDERGFMAGCSKLPADDNWRQRARIIAHFAQTAAYVSINRVCGELAHASPADIEWVVANFLLVRGPRSYLAIAEDQKYGYLTNIKLLAASVGRPIGDIVEIEGSLIRAYERALVVVNPASDQDASFVLPLGSFHTQDGRLITTKVDLPPRSAIVLYKDP